jgi:hypothetical protein
MNRRRNLLAGFTLVELMVAVTGGLFVTIAVFALSKQTTNIYQAEARIGNATMGSVVGFDRLRTDIARAGYLVSPNVSLDPKLCGVPDASWAHSTDNRGQYLEHLSSIFIKPSASADIPGELKMNGITPDEITLAGSYASVDQFPTGAIYNNGTNYVVTLQVASAPMARLGFDPSASPAAQQTLLSSVFATGRGLRIVDTSGREQYGQIVSVNTAVSPPQILLAAPTATLILFRGQSNTYKCGIQGNGDRSLVNVVNFIRYSVRNLSTDPRFAPLYATAKYSGTNLGTSTDAGRGELVREELDAAGATITDANNLPIYEVISEFAVDLAFGITVSQFVASGGNQAEALTNIPAGSASIGNYVGEAWAAAPLAPSTTAPQYVRVVHARLGIRSHEADRLSGVPTAGDGGGVPIAGGLYRIGLGTPGPNMPPFARVRTLQADIALRNHRGITW